MRKYLLIPLLILPVVIFASSNSFLNLYNSGLNQDPTYQSANINFIQAQNNLNSLTSFFVPTLSLTTPSVGLTFNATGLENSTSFLDINLGILNLYSTTIGFSLPLNVSNMSFQAPEFSVSRSLIVEDQADMMQAKSAYSNALWSIQNTKWSYLTTLVQNIFNWYYYNQMVNLYTQQVSVLKDVYNSINPENYTQQNAAYQQLLSSQSALANYQNSLQTIQPLPNFTPYSTQLYQDTMTFVSSITSNFSTDINVNDVISNRNDVKALQYQYQAYQAQGNLWFLPFIPNPTITFAVPLNNISKWSISLSLNFSLLNGGSNVIQSQQRLTNVQIGQEELQNATTTDTLSLNGLILKQKSLEISLTAAQNNVQTALQAFQTAEALYKEGLESQDNYTLANLSYQESLLSEQQVQQQILLNEIQIMQTEGISFGGEGI
ncbi:TolC family protein [Athalassotoga sp.]|uniref:TolC family protein n=1 Tax=Athalassotoga sp. TaxID=2022597 RepID=UPI003D024779